MVTVRHTHSPHHHSTVSELTYSSKFLPGQEQPDAPTQSFSEWTLNSHAGPTGNCSTPLKVKPSHSSACCSEALCKTNTKWNKSFIFTLNCPWKKRKEKKKKEEEKKDKSVPCWLWQFLSINFTWSWDRWVLWTTAGWNAKSWASSSSASRNFQWNEATC